MALGTIVYYNIYKAVDPMGPWELVNETPIHNETQGNQFTIEDLQNDQIYYIMVVGGRYDNETGVFVPICGQPIQKGDDPGSNVINPNIIKVRPKII